jgi:hypothetical protein
MGDYVRIKQISLPDRLRNRSGELDRAERISGSVRGFGVGVIEKIIVSPAPFVFGRFDRPKKL